MVSENGRSPLASRRLHRSARAHLLGSMFERLCRDGVPTGPDIFEITRLCLPPTEPKTERRRLRDGLIHAMVAHGLEHRSEEHTSELQSLMRISYAVFFLKKKKKINTTNYSTHETNTQQTSKV